MENWAIYFILGIRKFTHMIRVLGSRMAKFGVFKNMMEVESDEESMTEDALWKCVPEYEEKSRVSLQK